MKVSNLQIAIIGVGGFGREVYSSLAPNERSCCDFFVDDVFYESADKGKYGINKVSYLLKNLEKYHVLVAVGNPEYRSGIVESLPKETIYYTHIHPSAQIQGDDCRIGEGSIVCAGSIITTNVHIGKHTHINLNSTIGHDCRIGNYFTTAPGAHISGNCNIGDRVYLGTNSSIREKITICDDVTVGMNGAVIKNIESSGTYIGVPVSRIK